MIEFRDILLLKQWMYKSHGNEINDLQKNEKIVKLSSENKYGIIVRERILRHSSTILPFVVYFMQRVT